MAQDAGYPVSNENRGECVDRFGVDPARVTVLLTRWEDPDEAAEFRKALAPVRGRRTFHGGATVALVAGSDAATSARVAAAALSRAQLDRKD